MWVGLSKFQRHGSLVQASINLLSNVTLGCNAQACQLKGCMAADPIRVHMNVEAAIIFCELPSSGIQFDIDDHSINLHEHAQADPT